MRDLVTYDVADGVAHIELNRPDAANALDLDLAGALGAAVERAGADEGASTILITGAGKRFCAGGDVGSFNAAPDSAAYLHELAIEADAAVRALADLPKPVVAGVHGAVAGAGLAIMLSCDLVVAEPGTKFLFAYPGIGLTPDCGLSWLLPRVMGQQRALSFALGGRTLSPDEALASGLVSEIAGNAVARAAELAGSLSAGPARALGKARRLLRDGWDTTREIAGAREARVISEIVQGDEAQRLLGCFLAR